MTGAADAPAVPPAGELVLALAERGETLAVAESLTGGLLTSAVVDVPGASAVLRGGVVAYATPLKRSLLGVDGALLAARGAVDADVAAAMARGVRDLLGADWGVSTTGVAGPDAQDGVRSGVVFVGVCPPGPAPALSYRLDLGGDRAAVRAACTAEAVRLLLAAVRQVDPGI